MRRDLPSPIEPLEDRIVLTGLPFTALHANSVQYTDVDGDLVTVSFSKNVITAGNANSIFTIVQSGMGYLLESIDLTHAGLANSLTGMNVSVTAKTPHGGAGNGRVNVGLINAPGILLGNVKVGGDLGAIEAGNGSTKNAMASLTLDSFGALGVTTQAGGGTLVSNVTGNLPKLTVSGNVDGESINVTGNVGTVSIKGNLDDVFQTGATGAGSIVATGNIGSVTIGGNLAGYTGSDSGYIASMGGSVGPVKIGKDLMGGGAAFSGAIQAKTNIGAVTINGNLDGGSVAFAGAVEAGGTISSLTVAKNMTAGSTARAGGEIGKVTVKGSITGTSAAPVIISGQGVTNAAATSDTAIGGLAVTHDMSYAVVLAGYDTALAGQDPNAQIGAVTVGGTFTASDLVAGVQGTMNAGNFEFGTASDATISGGMDVVLPSLFSKIASVKVGAVAGDAVSGAHYGITAGYVGSVKVGSTTEALQSGAENDLFATSKQLLVASPNLTVDEVVEPELFHSLHANSMQYTDSDGNLATVSFSKNFITAANVTSIFTLTSAGSGSQLESIDLTGAGLASKAAGTNITVTAKTPQGANANVNVGAINATGISLGNVSVAGDLGVIHAGKSVATNAVASLTLTTFGAQGGTVVSGFSGNVPKLTVNGNVDGESIVVTGNLTTALIKGNLDASTQAGVANAGSLLVGGEINSVTVQGNVIGNAAPDSGEISSGSGSIASVNIGGNLDGSAGTQGNSGYIKASAFVSAVQINGNVIGGAGSNTGAIQAQFGIGTVNIGGSLEGGGGAFAGSLYAKNSITSVMVGGDISAGATVRAGGSIGKITVTGGITGTSTAPVIISAQGIINNNLKTDVAIGSLSVTNNMEYAVVLAGYDTGLGAQDPNAQIGPVSVGGNFASSDLVAGVLGTMNGNSFVFGTGSDAAISTGNVGVMPGIMSKIASVTINGTVTGDSISGAFYGITAENVISVKVGSTTESLQAGASNDIFPTTGHPTASEISLASNVTIDEVTAA